MRKTLSALTTVFGSGAFGGLLAALALFAAGKFGLTKMLGVKMAPGLTPDWIYMMVVWGGIWGAVFMIRMLRNRPWWKAALMASLFPAAAAFVWFLPHVEKKGYFGMALGSLAPVIILAVCLIWAFVTSFTLRKIGFHR